MHGGITSKAVRAVCYSALGRITRTLAKSRDNEMSCVCCSQWGPWTYFLGLILRGPVDYCFTDIIRDLCWAWHTGIRYFRYRLGDQGSPILLNFTFFSLKSKDGTWWVAQPPCAIYSIFCATFCTLWLLSRILESLCRGEREYGLNFPPMSPTGDIGMWRHWNILGKRMISFW